MARARRVAGMLNGRLRRSRPVFRAGGHLGISLNLRHSLLVIGILAALAVAPPVHALEDTPTPTETFAETATPTLTPTETPTAAPTLTGTATVMAETPSPTPTPTATVSPTLSGTPPAPHIAFLFAASDSRVQNEWECSFNLASSLGFSSVEDTFRRIAADDPMALRNLFQVIYVAPGLGSDDYAFLKQMVAPGGVIEQFVSSGGVAVINAAGAASDQLDIAPDGVGFAAATSHDSETILAASHPYVTGAKFGGQALTASDFENWQHTDLGVLTALPSESTTVLANADGPSWVEYRHGNGRVIVTTLTYCTLAEPNSQQAAARNLLRYSRFFSGSAFTPGPTSPPEPTATVTRTPTSSPTITSTSIPSLTPTLTLAPTATHTPGPTDTPTFPATSTPTDTPAATPTPTSTSTATFTEVPASTATPTATSTPSLPSCAGDCDGNRHVTVDEILTLVNIALGSADMSACRAGDLNHNDRISIDEILAAVNNALGGCPPTAPAAKVHAVSSRDGAPSVARCQIAAPSMVSIATGSTASARENRKTRA